MPVHEKDGAWWWGGKGPFPSKAKAEEVELAACANGYRGDSSGKRNYIFSHEAGDDLISSKDTKPIHTTEGVFRKKDGEWQKLVATDEHGEMPPAWVPADEEEAIKSIKNDGLRGDSYDFSASTRSYDSYGRMDVSMCRISKECVSPYLGRSLPNWQGLGLDPDRTYYIYRPAEELIRAAESFNSVPVTIEHPGQLDTPDNPQDRVGTTGTDTRFEAPYLITSLKLWEREAIDGVENGTRKELSIFPSFFEVDMTSGEFMGQAYDGIARNISGNSVALTYRGRIGADCAVGDSQDQKVTLMEGLKELIKEKFATASDSEVDEMAAGVLELLKKHEESEIKKGKTGDNEDKVKKDNPGDKEDPDKNKKDRSRGDEDPEDKDKKPMGDSAIKELVAQVEQRAVAKARAEFQETREAQRIVEPAFGHVSGDSADEIYKAALAQVGVDVAGLPSAALKPMTELAIKNKTAASITTGDSADRGNPNDFKDLF